MAAGLHALRDDDVGASLFGGLCFAQGRDRCEPFDPLVLHSRDIAIGKQTHHRRDGLRSSFDQRFTLRLKIGERDIAGIACNGRAPLSEELPQPSSTAGSRRGGGSEIHKLT